MSQNDCRRAVSAVDSPCFCPRKLRRSSNLVWMSKVSDTFTVSSADGTTTTVQVTISGTNDAAVLSSATVALAETNAPLTTGGVTFQPDAEKGIKRDVEEDAALEAVQMGRQKEEAKGQYRGRRRAGAHFEQNKQAKGDDDEGEST